MSSVNNNYQVQTTNARNDSSKRTDESGNVINAVFSDKKANSVSMDDFLQLMVAQLQNQDFMNPMDDTQYVTQLAQFSAMQQMQEVAQYSKSNFMASLVGKTVTAAKFTIGGNVNKVEGVVTKLSLVDNEYKAFVNGVGYTMDQIMEINETSDNNKSTDDLTALLVKGKTKDSVSVEWKVPTTDTVKAAGLRYTVYYSKDKNFDSVEEVKSGVCFGTAQRSDLTKETITGLDPDTTYFINVVVTDFEGNESVLSKTAATTLAKSS